MVQVASSSKSNRSPAKTVRTAFKVGPPTTIKKPVAVSIAKAKKNKQRSQNIKKNVGTGKYFFFWAFANLMLNLIR
jgi:hypothetical protein